MADGQPKTSRLYPKWRETLVYEEGTPGHVESHTFECGWGVSPGYVYVPAAEDWDAEVPAFLHGRREEMLTLLREKSGHVVEESPPRKKK